MGNSRGLTGDHLQCQPASQGLTGRRRNGFSRPAEVRLELDRGNDQIGQQGAGGRVLFFLPLDSMLSFWYSRHDNILSYLKGVEMSKQAPAVAEIKPFRIEIPQSEIDDLKRRLAATRWPDDL